MGGKKQVSHKGRRLWQPNSLPTTNTRRQATITRSLKKSNIEPSFLFPPKLPYKWESRTRTRSYHPQTISERMIPERQRMQWRGGCGLQKQWWEKNQQKPQVHASLGNSGCSILNTRFINHCHELKSQKIPVCTAETDTNAGYSSDYCALWRQVQNWRIPSSSRKT